MTALAARIEIPGTHNFREVAPDGIRPGRLYRSDAIARLGEPGREMLAGLGIRRILDLRSVEEIEWAPDDIDPAEVELLVNPMFAGSVASMVAGEIDLVGLYGMLIAESGPAIASALRAVADAEGGVLVHCTAGKDRTGIVVALALAVAGVAREVIVADYVRTEDYLAGDWAEAMLARVRAWGAEPDAQMIELISRSPASAIEHVFAVIDEAHGGLEVYLDGIGFDADARARLAGALSAVGRGA